MNRNADSTPPMIFLNQTETVTQKSFIWDTGMDILVKICIVCTVLILNQTKRCQGREPTHEFTATNLNEQTSSSSAPTTSSADTTSSSASTSSSTSASSVSSDCLVKDIAYYGDDLKESVFEKLDTVQACQASCEQEAKCKFWSYYTSWKACYIKSGKGIETPFVGFVSGDRNCKTWNTDLLQPHHVLSSNFFLLLLAAIGK